MELVWRDPGGLLIWCAVAPPLGVLAVLGLVRWRCRRGMPVGRARWRSVAEVGAVLGTLPWLWLVFTPQQHPRLVHLVPFSDLVDQVHSMPPGWIAEQTVGNLLVFAALGFCAPIRSAALAGVGRLLVLGTAASALVEFAQYMLDIGRVASVDDVLLNAVGTGLAGMLSRRWWRAGASDPPGPGGSRVTGASANERRGPFLSLKR